MLTKIAVRVVAPSTPKAVISNQRKYCVGADSGSLPVQRVLFRRGVGGWTRPPRKSLLQGTPRLYCTQPSDKPFCFYSCLTILEPTCRRATWISKDSHAFQQPNCRFTQPQSCSRPGDQAPLLSLVARQSWLKPKVLGRLVCHFSPPRPNISEVCSTPAVPAAEELKNSCKTLPPRYRRFRENRAGSSKRPFRGFRLRPTNSSI